MNTTVDVSTFTSPSDFENALRSMKMPARPRKPGYDVRKENFDSDAEYYRAMAEASEEYEKMKVAYDDNLKRYRKARVAVLQAFKEFAINDNFSDDFPDEVKNDAYELIHNNHHDEGLSSIYDALSDYSDIINKAYRMGLKAS